MISSNFLAVNKYDDDIPEDHISRLIKKMVKSDFKYLDDEFLLDTQILLI